MVGLRQAVEVFIDRNLTPAAQSARLAQVARDGVASLVQQGRAQPQYRRYVDGAEGVDEARVRPDGVILYRFQAQGQVANWALNFLCSRSPVGVSGAGGQHFRDGFFFAFNGGRMVPAAGVAFDKIGPDVRTITIGNAVPYARKVDVQMVGTKPLRFSVPSGLWADAAKEINRRFGGMVRATRENSIRFPGQYMLRRGRRRGKPVDSPALIIEVL